MPEVASTELPSRRDALVLAGKAVLLRQHRSIQNRLRPVSVCLPGSAADFPLVLASNRSPLWTEADARELRLEAGKVHNLRIVCRLLDGRIVPAGQTFSFWKHVGRPTRRRGFVPGRQIVSGCVVPAVAGGICQLTNALFQALLDAGLEVVERHPHTRRLARGSPADGRDATVAWNYIDLRFRPTSDILLVARMTETDLVMELRARQPLSGRRSSLIPLSGAPAARSCETCGEQECFRHQALVREPDASLRTAWLVDQVQPEFLALAQSESNPEDLLMTPAQGRHRRLQRYDWTASQAETWSPTPFFILRRSLESRRLAEQGAERRRAMLRHEAELARLYAARIPFEARHLVIAQQLLPELWRLGALGGRSFSVLMTRLPLAEIHRRLDAAHAANPDRVLLNDFRAAAALVALENEALQAAREVITPHEDIARFFPGRVRRIPWAMPPAATYTPGRRVFFPGPTVSRKGAFEVREAARRLGLKLVVGGSMLEGSTFWEGVDVISPGPRPFDGCCAVVLPAIVEDQPRTLLRALASGLPVIATPACGLFRQAGLCIVEPGNVEALTCALQQFGEKPAV